VWKGFSSFSRLLSLTARFPPGASDCSLIDLEGPLACRDRVGFIKSLEAATEPDATQRGLAAENAKKKFKS
jgi:hypothetical protein